DAGKNLHLSIVWDEFGDYDNFEDLEPLGKGLRSLLRESSKHEYYPILIAHGDQASFYPGVANILTTLKSSTVKVETIGEPVDDFGTMAPTGRAVVTWLDGTTEDLVLPPWLTVSFLLNLLPPVASTASVSSIANPEESKNQPMATTKTTQEPEEAYPTKEAESLKDEDAIARVRNRLIEKILELNGEWASVSKLMQDFRADDRQVVKQLIQSAVMSGVLQSEKRDNPNGTKSQFVKVVSRDSANKN
ncbi:hypothetical protein NDI52_28420, partial [Leptolyngbya sp. PL-A3]|uniref:hypothetical protein n=1 Tax=Leptolyngbya sp. PL-A3 TaxID=2933911 RepID=UPI003297C248